MQICNSPLQALCNLLVVLQLLNQPVFTVSVKHIHTQNWTACADFPNIVAKHHSFGGAHPGGYDPQIRTQLRFLYNAPTPKFHHPMFTCLEVIMLTNKRKQMQLKTSNVLRDATPLAKYCSQSQCMLTAGQWVAHTQKKCDADFKTVFIYCDFLILTFDLLLQNVYHLRHSLCYILPTSLKSVSCPFLAWALHRMWLWPFSCVTLHMTWYFLASSSLPSLKTDNMVIISSVMTQADHVTWAF